MKKLLSVLLLSLAVVLHLKAYDLENGGIMYNYVSYQEQTVAVTSHYSGNGYVGDISIPHTFRHSWNGPEYTVVGIESDAFRNSSELTSVSIPEGISFIGENAFKDCIGLTEIILPESLETLRDSIFEGCSGLTNISLPGELTSIGNRTFYRCSALTEISLPITITSIGEGAFSYCSSITDISLPYFLTVIEDHTFEKCANLTYVEFPIYLEKIGSYAFTGCNLSGISGSLWFNKTLKYIGDEAFCASGSFYRFTFPEKITHIGVGVLANNPSLKEIYINSSNPYYYSGSNNVIIERESQCLIAGCNGSTIPDGVKTIGLGAFVNCPYLKDIEIPSSVEDFASLTFWMCPLITELTIPGGVKKFYGTTIRDCTGITKLVLEEGVEYYYSVSDSPIQYLSLPSTLSNTVSFDNMEDLTDCYVNWTTSNIPKAKGIIQGNKATLHVPYGTKSLYEAAPGWQDFCNIVESEPESMVEIADGAPFTLCKDYTVDVKYTRTFNNTNWQALYVPFSIPVETLKAHGLTVAELNDTHMYDTDGDGELDRIDLEFQYINRGSTEANYPCLIKSESAVGEISFTLENVELKAAAEAQIECSTTRMVFTVTGTYTGVSGDVLFDNNYYAMAGGRLARLEDNTGSLKPQRWYMSMANKDGSQVNYPAAQMRIVVDGLYEEETGVAELETSPKGQGVVYSLDGRVLNEAKVLKGGLYIKNNKIMIVR